MKATPDCLVCTMEQALRAARVATRDRHVQRAILDATARRIPTLDLDDAPAVVSMCAYELTSQISGNGDPYRHIRHEQNAQALALEPELRAMVRESEDPLMATLHLAAAGNIIDLGTMRAEHIDVGNAVRQVMEESFAVEHLDAFRASLGKCEDLLFLLDNAGEIVFDKVLIEELQRHTKVTAVVKGGPILNDVIMEDAEQAGLTDVCEVIDNGGPFIGCPLKLVPPEFLQRMADADVILGKGQGNYETVDDFPGDVFLILRAKCPIVAHHMGVELGQVGIISTRGRAAANLACSSR